MAGFLAREADKLFDRIEWVLPITISGISDVPMGRVLCGAWLNSRNFMRLGCAFGDEAAAPDQENRGRARSFGKMRYSFTNSTTTRRALKSKKTTGDLF